MRISAELRWFWRGDVPPAFEKWFRESPTHPYPVGGGNLRQDDYLVDPGQTELGIKTRGGGTRTDIKGLFSRAAGAVSESPFRGQAEVWMKWTSNALQLDKAHKISTKKTRWMRKFDTTGPTPRELELGPDEEPLHENSSATGCNVELTLVEISGEVWWTFGFECFGELGLVTQQLRTVATSLAAREPPEMGNPVPASYPAWLSDRTQMTSALPE